MIGYLVNRAKEPSTWRGLVFVLTAIGVKIDPSLGEAIITTGIAVAGLIGVVAPDNKENV